MAVEPQTDAPSKPRRQRVRIASWPKLDRSYSLLAFDWDGTAVASRSQSTESLRLRTFLLDRMGVWLVIITGTKYDNLNSQYFRQLPPEARHHHIACVNRGSEVFGFDEHGQLQTLHRRMATQQENLQMDAIAVQIRDELSNRYNLQTHIVFDRFNRRKLDLIPFDEWADPPKNRIGDLLNAVKARLQRAGVSRGIQGIMDRVAEIARQQGIALRLTTDVKHVEFGLTDKSDSLAYLAEQLAPTHGIGPSDILVAGDEFGPIDGFEGSDCKTFGLAGATYVSVGLEPNGVPDGVIHIGGGDNAFLALLDHQIDLWRQGVER